MRLHAPLQGPRTRVLDRNVYSRLEDMKNVPEGLASAGNILPSNYRVIKKKLFIMFIEKL